MVDYVGQHQAGLLTDQKLKEGFYNSIFIGFFVVLLTVPIGLAAALVLTQINPKLKSYLFTINNACVISRSNNWNINSSIMNRSLG